MNYVNIRTHGTTINVIPYISAQTTNAHLIFLSTNLTAKFFIHNCFNLIQFYFNTSAANSVPPEVTSLKQSQIQKHVTRNFHICNVYHDIIKVFYSPTNAQAIVLKTVLTFRHRASSI